MNNYVHTCIELCRLGSFSGTSVQLTCYICTVTCNLDVIHKLLYIDITPSAPQTAPWTACGRRSATGPTAPSRAGPAGWSGGAARCCSRPRAAGGRAAPRTPSRRGCAGGLRGSAQVCRFCTYFCLSVCHDTSEPIYPAHDGGTQKSKSTQPRSQLTWDTLY